MKKITVGILAHVDAGKTTLSEAMLYISGTIRKLGRVDKRDAFLDTYAQERERGITIFSKQAELAIGDAQLMLLDTPGHVDFSSEMERTLQVLDYAILVISGKDGVQGHTVTLWKLLQKYQIPAFIFVNKMDLETSSRDLVYGDIRRKLSGSCMDFSKGELGEDVAAVSEALIEEYLEHGRLEEESVAEAIRKRELFPCYFGSALKLDGVENFLAGIERFTLQEDYSDEFGAVVYKITRDSKGTRLSHMKITGGSLKTRELIDGEKVDQIRIYSGEKFKTVSEAEAGSIVAVCGLSETRAGQGIGSFGNQVMPTLEPALVYDVIIESGEDAHTVLERLYQLEEEDPQLHVRWNSETGRIQTSLMGEVQLEILKVLIEERFGMNLSFGEGRIAYKETIKNPVVGAGHFEPLRHYAEVQLLMEPGERGSGIDVSSACSTDVLDKNWQRLIATHVLEREHPGVLTGSPLTDVSITIVAGRAHEKHTEGGDFRQATYRAIRQGLMKAETILLEPWYSFIIEIPQESVGTAMADVQRMGGSFDMPESEEGTAILKGRAPVSEMKDYALKLNSYTKGHGHLQLAMEGYFPCHNQEEVIELIGYDPERDAENPADSVFCAHGAGYNVKWDEVDDAVHTSVYIPGVNEERVGGEQSGFAGGGGQAGGGGVGQSYSDEDFSHPAFVQPKKREIRERKIAPKEFKADYIPKKTKEQATLTEYVLVDGYNIIFAWEDLKELSKVNIDAARDALIEMMQNYQGYRKCRLVLVFDAYRVKGGERRQEVYDNITVVYTKEAETADAYIEKATYELRGKYKVRVATSDRMEQLIIIGNDAFKVSAQEFRREVEAANLEIKEMLREYSRKHAGTGNRIKIKKIRD
ncbi:MAG: TetM/TetW/TetO/TetS family tetracycline resistance ribosomal protection protein [Firmicutes bacterium]|nr:TetM/TetW/TetO/TetS family tetracycline resistance ribosomal protection protein [Bacillota bacterium]